MYLHVLIFYSIPALNLLVVVSISLDVFGSDIYMYIYVICIANIIKFMHPLFSGGLGWNSDLVDH